MMNEMVKVCTLLIIELQFRVPVHSCVQRSAYHKQFVKVFRTIVWQYVLCRFVDSMAGFQP